MTDPYALSDSTLEIADRWYGILNDGAVKTLLGIQDVWFGDQNILPHTPSVCVEPGIERRVLQGVPDMTRMEIDTIFLVYHSKVGGEQQQAKRDSVAFAQAIKHYLHVNHLRLFNAAATQQLTIHGYCTEFDPGYAHKQRTLYNAVQMTWTNLTKVSLNRQF